MAQWKTFLSFTFLSAAFCSLDTFRSKRKRCSFWPPSLLPPLETPRALDGHCRSQVRYVPGFIRAELEFGQESQSLAPAPSKRPGE